MAAFGLRFRFRSPERDRATDEARVADIHRVLEQAISAAEAEKRGLEGRIRIVRAEAAYILDGVDDVGTRSDSAEQTIAAAEQRLLIAEERLRTLNAHIGGLKEVQNVVTQIFATS